MFAVVELTAPEKAGFIRRIFRRKMVNRIAIEEREVADTKYYLLKLPVPKEGPDLYGLRLAAGREYSRLLLPEEFPLREDAPVGRYDSGNYLKKIMFNGLMQLLKISGVPAKRLSVVICDQEARYIDCSCKILEKAACVFVATARRDRYLELSEYTMQNYGAQFMVLELPCTLPDAPIVFAPYGMNGCTYEQEGRMIFSPIKEDRAFMVNGDCIRLPEPFLSGVPAGIRPETFAAALYEQAGQTRLGALIPDFFVRTGQRHTLDDMAMHLQILDSGYPV